MIVKRIEVPALKMFVYNIIITPTATAHGGMNGPGDLLVIHRRV